MPEDATIASGVCEIIDNAAARQRHSLTDKDFRQFMALPEGYSVHSLEDFQTAPNKIVAAPKFRDVASLSAYLARFEREESVALSRLAENEIRVVIDHHVDSGTAAWAKHTATFKACFTPEYQAWREIDRKPIGQVTALEFLEERAIDVVEPGAADIMDIIMNFDALKRVTFRQSTRLHDGQRQFLYHEENEVKGQINLPEMIALRLPVYEGMEPDVIKVRIRYRIDDGKLTFAFLIDQRPALEMTAFERCEDALKVARRDLLILRSY